jgi:hypothetical protein
VVVDLLDHSVDVIEDHTSSGGDDGHVGIRRAVRRVSS